METDKWIKECVQDVFTDEGNRKKLLERYLGTEDIMAVFRDGELDQLSGLDRRYTRNIRGIDENSPGKASHTRGLSIVVDDEERLKEGEHSRKSHRTTTLLLAPSSAQQQTVVKLDIVERQLRPTQEQSTVQNEFTSTFSRCLRVSLTGYQMGASHLTRSSATDSPQFLQPVLASTTTKSIPPSLVRAGVVLQLSWRRRGAARRGYQERPETHEICIEGVNWLLYHFQQQMNVTLAHEMGLGKITQIVSIVHQQESAPFTKPESDSGEGANIVVEANPVHAEIHHADDRMKLPSILNEQQVPDVDPASFFRHPPKPKSQFRVIDSDVDSGPDVGTGFTYKTRT
ncbi:hypothetical protein F5Y05DRAFT_410597 [Hypoxylon sp. FL0543]|nr:hypothetical protein F5Y05DRAFT_410597 [Hypoxylon sp. FL0543]